MMSNSTDNPPQRPRRDLPACGELDEQRLVEEAQQLGVTLSPEAITGLITYTRLLFEMNATMNLVRVQSVENWLTRHLLDALALVPHLPENAKVLDLGAGGGIPGVPLAVARPDITVTALDATAKKCRFLESLIEPLGLSERYSVRTGRAEDWGHQEDFRSQYDVVTARAVATLYQLLEWSIPFLKPKGVLLAMKGQKAEQELAEATFALKALHAAYDKTLQFEHPALEASRVIVIVKTQPTPNIYPRMSARAAKNPLLKPTASTKGHPE